MQNIDLTSAVSSAESPNVLYVNCNKLAFQDTVLDVSLNLPLSSMSQYEKIVVMDRDTGISYRLFLVAE